MKIHFKTKSGIKNLKSDQAAQLYTDPDYATRDLVNHIDQGKTAEWDMFIQAIPEKDGYSYPTNIFDVTKVIPHGDYPLIPVGTFVLNRNVDNYFAETEQSAFSPGHLVPGMEPSPDKMLQGRLFSYPDTHRHRLGANYEQIPVNCPYRAKVHNGHRDGPMRVDGNRGNLFLMQVLNPTMNPTHSQEQTHSVSIRKPNTSRTELLGWLHDTNQTIQTAISSSQAICSEKFTTMKQERTQLKQQQST